MQESADIYKENMIEDLENGSLKLPTVGEFLANLKQKFRNGNNELVKITKLKKVEQELKIIEEFVQEFRRVIRGSSFEGRLLIKKFKRGMNRVI